ncbi:MAG: glucosidase [Hamadaea sp.]|nr:glucosidase [Hamadaea sp.]
MQRGVPEVGMGATDATAEGRRLAEADAGGQAWKSWGPYVAERAWGTVREDYSEGGTAWSFFPHDHARSRAYRWNEDGLAAICDERQTFCLGLALWNGVDPILKERLFGLTGEEGNHGEDAKEYWWHTDSTPTHSWMSWRYHYPQREFPYNELVTVNRGLSRDEPEYELDDTGVFDEDRYWSVTVEYAKAGPVDVCARVTVKNHGPDRATLHVLPTLWFRNTWSWEPQPADAGPKPVIVAAQGVLQAHHPELGELWLRGDPGVPALACDNETNTRRLWDCDGPAYPKDGINDHVVHGAATVNPAGTGTKAALHHTLTVDPGGVETIELRLTRVAPGETPPPFPGDHADVLAARRTEADAYFARLLEGVGAEQARVARAAVAGLMWSKQFYHLDQVRWLSGDPGHPAPEGHRHGRNARWPHLSAADVILMPDPWEYPWFAAWDLAFHCVAAARVDPELAKQQILLLLRDWYQHPNGQIPAYEWAFDDVNPPVHAWAALQVFRLDGGRDFDFLGRVMHKLMLNFTWWLNRKDVNGDNLFEGGFLGLDNIGPIDRSAALPVAGVLEQSDGTGWMALYAVNMLDMAIELAHHDPLWTDLATGFFEHFATITAALNRKDLWDEETGFYYDVIRRPDGSVIPLRVRSIAGLLPLCAVGVFDSAETRVPALGERFRRLLDRRPELRSSVQIRPDDDGGVRRLLSAVAPDRLTRMLGRMFDAEEFLSPHGIRSLSQAHRDEPFTVHLGGADFTVGYEPAESSSGTFGGNSNWRGPIWFPLNYLMVDALDRYGDFYGDQALVEFPVGSGDRIPLAESADRLAERLVGLFLPATDGVRPIYVDEPVINQRPEWRDLVIFPEYFHGDTGAALGASHQTGWTALVLNLILRRPAAGR